MKKGYFLTKNTAAYSPLVRKFIKVCKFVFAERTILLVTNKKIRSIKVSASLQVAMMLVFIWVGNLFVQTLRYNEVISVKSEEISKLKSINDFFEEEVSDLNEKLTKIDEYLGSVTGGNVQNVNGQEQKIRQPKDVNIDDLSGQDEHTFNQIKDANSKILNIQYLAQSRIKKIENAISITGLNLKKIPQKKMAAEGQLKEISLNDKKGIADRQGGPIDESSLDSIMSIKSDSEDDLERDLERAKFVSEFDYLMTLEKVASSLPFAKPMRNYYISSGFGARSDPLTHRVAKHQGLDFVGMNKEKIFSPSSGVVILAGKFSDYGNAVVIDHGSGVTTRYGHLSEVKVKKGQLVKKGDIIALQGSTGRSTGQHLHYEVRYKNTPLNPKKFLEAGEALANDEKTAKHVRS